MHENFGKSVVGRLWVLWDCRAAAEASALLTSFELGLSNSWVNLLFSFHIFWLSLFHLSFAFPPFNILLSVSRCPVHSVTILTSDSFTFPFPLHVFQNVWTLHSFWFSLSSSWSKIYYFLSREIKTKHIESWCVQFLLSEGRVTFTECHSACSRGQRAQQGSWASISCQGSVLSHHTTHTALMTRTFSDQSPWPNGVRMTSLWQSAGDVAMAPQHRGLYVALPLRSSLQCS